MIQPFDRNGQPVRISDAERATLTPPECERLDAMYAAFDAMKAGEARVQAAVDKVQAAVEQINTVDLLLKQYPPLSFVDLMRASTTFAHDMARLKR